MLEKIYTIPINETFDLCAEEAENGCPFCLLYRRFQADELDLILGPSLMEPAVRIKTNAAGFCAPHYEMLLSGKNRLGLSLMLESHLEQVEKELSEGFLDRILGGPGGKSTKKMDHLEQSCYLCERIENSMTHVFENAAVLWQTDRDFRKKLEKQPCFCLPHYRRFILAGKQELSKKECGAFYEACRQIVFSYMQGLRADVSHFCRKFDYRYENEPWGTAKDAPERAAKFLCGDQKK